MEATGKKLHPAHKSNGITKTWVKADHGILNVGFTQEFGNDARFLPALFKIGLNLVSKFYGPAVAASAMYDHIRTFVRREVGALPLTFALEARQGTEKGTGDPRLITKAGRAYPMLQFEILGVFFLLDMAPDQPMLRDLRGAATLMDQKLYVFPAQLRTVA